MLIPCYNEELGDGKVVAGFPRQPAERDDLCLRQQLAATAPAGGVRAGAVVRSETLQGKGHVVRRMFADVEADVYVLVDGDDTYDAAAAPAMVRMLLERQLDMVSAARVTTQEAAPIGAATGWAIAVLSGLVRRVFGNRVSDLLSGYRVFSRRFVKSFPALAVGFETETEFTVHALELNMPIGETCHALSRPGRRVALQAAHLRRRAAHPAHHRDAGEAGTAAAILRR